MIFRGLTTDGDWTFGKGKMNYFITDEAISANIKTRILSWKGDCFFDTQAGIDWINRIGNRGVENLLKEDLRVLIIQSYGVSGILNLDLVISVRTFILTANIVTIHSSSVILIVERNI